MDIAIIGLIAAFVLILMAILLGGSLSIFIDVPSFLRVVGVTIGVTLVNFPLKGEIMAIGIVKNAFFNKLESLTEYINMIITFVIEDTRDKRHDNYAVVERSLLILPPWRVR